MNKVIIWAAFNANIELTAITGDVARKLGFKILQYNPDTFLDQLEIADYFIVTVKNDIKENYVVIDKITTLAIAKFLEKDKNKIEKLSIVLDKGLELKLGAVDIIKDSQTDEEFAKIYLRKEPGFLNETVKTIRLNESRK